MADSRDPPRPSTFFLPAERAAPATLEVQIAWATTNAVVDGILSTWAGAAAILNPQRQIVALNARYLEAIGLDDPGAALGLRPGEAIGCDHARELPGGCGTSRACAGCGAAQAIVSAIARDRPEERECVVTVPREGRDVDVDLRIRAAPLHLEGQPFTLLTLVDVSADRRRAALERSFFHDLTDLASSLAAAGQALDDPDPAEREAAAQDLRFLTARLSREVQVQRALAMVRPAALRVTVERLALASIASQLERLFRHHPVAAGKSLAVRLEGDGVVDTDGFLLHRIVTSMLVNAFEATAPGGEVRLTIEDRPAGPLFRVWNAGAIPPALAARIFHRFFSTKPGAGRGQGTFGMRLFGETYLKGEVRFATSPEGGTTFELALPRSLGPPVPAWARGARPE